MNIRYCKSYFLLLLLLLFSFVLSCHGRITKPPKVLTPNNRQMLIMRNSTVTYEISTIWRIGDTSFWVYLKQRKIKVKKIKGWETWQAMLSIPFSVISFSHIIYLIERGFEIIGESLRMVINIEYTIVSNIEPLLYCSSWCHEPCDKQTLSLPEEKELK